ncbi:Amino-acid acetyltransferase, mitochondrial [Coemansia guatemalensis]|uniref:Amino-acid acetyltransferase, mitochondrial n=1 Tax=Coemansia guatemalensis TaxID=2761395 RepID=A0A9W8I637_9FUNG|nr:Amino-acid acetyltransferase, mitochondrial [Coemansia guatemalensis]
MQAHGARALGYWRWSRTICNSVAARNTALYSSRVSFSSVSPSPQVPDADGSASATATAHPGSVRNHRERELILSVLSTVPSPREARKFLNSVSGGETMRSQRAFEEQQARLAMEQPAVRTPGQLVPGEILPSAGGQQQQYARAETGGAPALETVPRKLTAAVFIDGLQSDSACERTGKLLAQIQRIGVTPVVMLGSGARDGGHDGYRAIVKRVHQLSDAIEREGGKARPINEGLFFNSPYMPSALSVDPELIGAAVAQNQTPIISPLMADSSLRVQVLRTQAAAPALARALAQSTSPQQAMAGSRGEFSLLLARLILLGNSDGLTSTDGEAFHRFVNLEEDYGDLAAAGCRQAETLDLMRICLGILPPTAAGIVASVDSDPSLVLKGLISERPVGTQHKSAAQRLQRDRNAALRGLNHTQSTVPSYKPLPNYPFVKIGSDRNAASASNAAAQPPTRFTLLRHGFRIQRHKSVDTCDLPRLRALLESSFKRTLDGDSYFDRLRALEKRGGIEIIIAGDYQGAVVATHEPLPGSDKPLPYLDKFAVLPTAQGTGMADILWAQLRRACPSCMWRSRNDNGVNKWYFDRSNGHFRSRALEAGEQGTRWVFFWYQSQAAGQRTLTADEIQAGIEVSQAIPPSFA